MIYQDIQISDNQLKIEYISKFLSGDYQGAFNIINNNPQLDTKAFVAECINDIASILYQLEDDTYSGTMGYMQNLVSEFNAIINQFLNRQAWSSTVAYKRYNFVIYNNLVYMYINATQSSGHLPTDTTYWLEIGIRGAQGANGSGITMKYDWVAGTTYQAKDLVIYGDAFWIALRTSTGRTPTEVSTYWQLFIRPSNAMIETSSTAPAKYYEGQIWFKILS